MLNKILSVGFFLLILSSTFSTRCFANDVFYDSFDVKNEENWTFQENNGWIKVDGKLGLYSTSTSFPYVIGNSAVVFPASFDYGMEVIFRFPDSRASGVGIGIGYTGLDGRNYSQFGIWSDSSINGDAFYYNDFYDRTNGCVNFQAVNDLAGRVLIPRISLSKNDWNTLKILGVGSSYDVSINDVFIYRSNGGQCIPSNIWFGNRLGNYTSWSQIEIDSVKIYIQTPTVIPTETSTPTPTSTLTPTPTSTLVPTPTLTPTLIPTSTPTPTATPTEIPTPTPTTRHKIIIIPGLGASWNSEAMVYNKTVGNSEWGMTPFVRNYDNLILALKNKGFVENEDLFVWNYDWRRPVSEIVEELNNFIAGKISDGEKVDLIGHSLGGLVARIWTQDHRDSLSLGRVISLGSPHFGAVKAYDVWSGAKIGEGFSPDNIALNVLVQLQKKNYQTKLETIRGYAPVLKDILPTFDFIKKNNVSVPCSELGTVNQYLSQKNAGSSSIFLPFKAMTGVGKSTEEWINLTCRNIIDRSFGIWPDGHPVGWKYGNGDGTVLLRSAVFPGDIHDEVVSDHGVLPSVLIDRILTELELGVPIGIVSDFYHDNAKIFFIGSPATMSLDCDGDTLNMDEMGFIVVGDSYRFCKINLTGIADGGEYHLVWGDTSGAESWEYIEGEIEGGQEIKLKVDMEKMEVASSTENGVTIFELMDRDLTLLKLKYPQNKSLLSAYGAFKKKNWNLFYERLTDFRRQTNEDRVSGRVIGYLRSYMAIYGQKINNRLMASFLYKGSGFEVKLVDSLLNKRASLSLLGAQNYEKMIEVYGKMGVDLKKSNYVSVFDSVLISRLAKEIK
ncbi:MAG: hypothetical protein WC841_02025 [Candidatus Shapirobacteria bacterium]|jgi:pimeloyl-ACP methyl ester carboxylesterase